MKLDRSKTGDGTGKYAVVKLRKVFSETAPGDAKRLLDQLLAGGFVDMGKVGDADEFFVIKLQDKYAVPALMAYAKAAMDDDPEYAREIFDMAGRARLHISRKIPD